MMDSGDDPPDPRAGPIAAVRWFRSTDHEGVVFVREMLSTAAVVAGIGLLLFAVSGVWPPMVAVESGSMEPHMTRGDLVFVVDEERLTPEAARGDTGVVPYDVASESGPKTFGDYGHVIVFRPDGSPLPVPIIHRAHFWVEEGENWYDEADSEYVAAADCEQLANCPAPHAGFVTKGDANPRYDQAAGRASPVKPAWIRGTAEVKIPWLGHVRLLLSDLLATTGPMTAAGPMTPTAVGPMVTAGTTWPMPATVAVANAVA